MTQDFFYNKSIDRFADCFFFRDMPQNFFPLIDQYENFYYEKNKVTNFSGGSGLLSTGLDYLKFANLLLNDGKLKNKRIFAKEVMNRIRTNSIDSDIASNGVRSFAQMPTVRHGP